MIKYIGTAASGGLAIGKIKIINRRITGFRRVVLAPHREKALLDAAIILAKDEIRQLMEKTDGAHKDILYFQLVMLDDTGLNDIIRKKVELGLGGAKAVEEAMEEYCSRLKNINDGYVSERGADIRDVLTRVVDILDGKSRERFVLTEPVIIVADEILPSDLATIDRNLAMGFITVGGSYQNHANIIARTMGIPSVCGVSSEILNPLHNGKTVGLDGYTGEIFITPSEAVVALLKHKMHLEERDTIAVQEAKNAKITLPNGEKVQIYANCNDPRDITLAINNGAEGIGLVRSEILFMSTAYNLTLESQTEFYSGCIIAAGGRPITIRTFDIGADKPLGEVFGEKEPNPALGMRGVRLMYKQPQLFKTQIEALLTAADAHGKINVMLPMVSVKKDFTDYMELVEQVKTRLFQEGKITKDNITWGVMIETPSAAIISCELAKVAGFFSIGTNDLTQYTMAADRINSDTGVYFNPAHPSVIALVEMAVKAAKEQGIPVSVCGESAADFECAKIYIEKGVRCLSMAQKAMLPIKQYLIDTYSPQEEI